MITIHFSSTPARKKPQVGDRKTVKGVEYVRQFKMAKCPRTGRTLGYDCTGGRQRYEWVEVRK